MSRVVSKHLLSWQRPLPALRDKAERWRVNSIQRFRRPGQTGEEKTWEYDCSWVHINLFLSTLSKTLTLSYKGDISTLRLGDILTWGYKVHVAY